MELQERRDQPTFPKTKPKKDFPSEVSDWTSTFFLLASKITGLYLNPLVRGNQLTVTHFIPSPKPFPNSHIKINNLLTPAEMGWRAPSNGRPLPIIPYSRKLPEYGTEQFSTWKREIVSVLESQYSQSNIPRMSGRFEISYVKATLSAPILGKAKRIWCDVTFRAKRKGFWFLAWKRSRNCQCLRTRQTERRDSSWQIYLTL